MAFDSTVIVFFNGKDKTNERSGPVLVVSDHRRPRPRAAAEEGDSLYKVPKSNPWSVEILEIERLDGLGI